MPEVEETPVVESPPETPESEPSTFEEAAESALSDQESSSEETPEVTPTVTETKVEETDPEHIAWAKSIAGHCEEFTQTGLTKSTKTFFGQFRDRAAD